MLYTRNTLGYGIEFPIHKKESSHEFKLHCIKITPNTAINTLYQNFNGSNPGQRYALNCLSSLFSDCTNHSRRWGSQDGESL